MAKLFSLIAGAEVHPAPDTHIIPAEEFATLASAQEIVARAEEEAAEQKRTLAAEGEIALKEAEARGFEAGLHKWTEQLALLNQELQRVEKEVHEQILPLALKAARKIVGEEMKLHPDRIADIVAHAIRPVVQHKKVILYVNHNDLTQLEEAKPRLKQLFEHLESFSIRERDDVEPGGCLIETEAGILNAQLEQQWRALEAAFQLYQAK